MLRPLLEGAAHPPFLMNDYLHAAEHAARLAGTRLCHARDSELNVDAAHDHDIKLELDRLCQDLITDELLRQFPDHSVFGEEGGSDYGATPFQWIVDPLDGTVNYFYGIPHFCVAIALQHNKTTVAAVTFDPIRDELFAAATDHPTTLNGRPVRVSPRSELREAIVATGFSKGREIVEQSLQHVRHFALNARKVRMNGSAALDMAYVAAGRIDVYFERGIRLWDIAGGALLVESAGGRIDLRPKPTPPLAFELIASNGRLPVSF